MVHPSSDGARHERIPEPNTQQAAGPIRSCGPALDGAVEGRDDLMRRFLQLTLLRRVREERQQLRVLDATDTAEECATEPACGVPWWKRAFDITAIVATAPLWMPLMVVVMLAVRLSSRGPIFFTQRRIGYRGRVFLIYKFRSMRMNAETESHENHFQKLMRNGIPMAKLDVAGDPRIIPWGRFLRVTGLDELPQIFNVVRGEMSLVGPRPCTPQEFEHFRPHEKARADALPGLTGLWQVNGKNETTFDEMICWDVHYTRNTSLRLDFEILLRTLPAIGRQAMAMRKAASSNRVSDSGDDMGEIQEDVARQADAL